MPEYTTIPEPIKIQIVEQLNSAFANICWINSSETGSPEDQTDRYYAYGQQMGRFITENGIEAIVTIPPNDIVTNEAYVSDPKNYEFLYAEACRKIKEQDPNFAVEEEFIEMIAAHELDHGKKILENSIEYPGVRFSITLYIDEATGRGIIIPSTKITQPLRITAIGFLQIYTAADGMSPQDLALIKGAISAIEDGVLREEVIKRLGINRSVFE